MLTDWIHWLSSLHSDELLIVIGGLLIVDAPRYVLSTVGMCLWDWTRDVWRFVTGRPENNDYTYCPSVCVILVGHNEAETIGAALPSIWGTYPRLEIIVVDDGSKDEMESVARRFAAGHEGVLVFRRERRGGKASAFNWARLYTQAEVIITVDADSHLGKSAIWEIVQPLEDPKVGAVSATILPRNAFTNLVTWLQAYEYLHAIFIGRMVSSRLRVLGIVSGALGAFRRQDLDRLMGWDVGHGEDGDLTLRIRKSGFRVAFAPYAQCFTNVPVKWRKLFKQRRRWNRGIIRHKSRKHIDMACFWRPNFRLSNLFHLLDAWFFRIFCLVAFWAYAVWYFLLNPAEDTWWIVVTLYMCYCAFHFVQLFPVLYYSNARGRDALICTVLPFVPFYNVFLKAARLVSITEEVFFRASYKDNFYPAHVRDATWHW